MTQRQLVLIDATQESIARSFAQNPIFQTWLNCYDDIEEALKFINRITLPYSINVFVARDNIIDEVQLPGTNGPTRRLLQIFCDLETILHVTILCPDSDTDLEQVIRGHIISPRMLNDPVSKNDLQIYICTEGIKYLNEQIWRTSTNEIHLMSNLRKNLYELMEYLNKLMNDQKPMLDAIEEKYSNKPGEEPS
jgi:hypothetical protein